MFQPPSKSYVKKIVLTNYHAFKPRDLQSVGSLTKSILFGDGKGENPFAETPEQMVRRVCRGLGTKKNIIVINDEAHHCYRRKPDGAIALTNAHSCFALRSKKVLFLEFDSFYCQL